jgi:ankyrin repeat protein
VRSNGWTALHWAAAKGNRRIVRSLVAFGADVNGQNCAGCAFSAGGESAWVRRPSPRRHLPCRNTPLHKAAQNGRPDTIAELLLRGADWAVQDNDG